MMLVYVCPRHHQSLTAAGAALLAAACCAHRPQTVCYESINTCPDDCKQTQVCDDGRRRLMGALKNLIGEHKNKDKASHPIAIKEEKVKYAPANCRWVFGLRCE
jgi:hypothetical protein